jgi:hypothetical protein
MLGTFGVRKFQSKLCAGAIVGWLPYMNGGAPLLLRYGLNPCAWAAVAANVRAAAMMWPDRARSPASSTGGRRGGSGLRSRLRLIRTACADALNCFAMSVSLMPDAAENRSASTFSGVQRIVASSYGLQRFMQRCRVILLALGFLGVRHVVTIR